MGNRTNIFVILAVIIFTFGAKYLQPFEADIKEYGFLGMAAVLFLFFFITMFFEYIIHKIYVLIKGSQNQ